MKVRIINASLENWYGDKIGKVFEVENHHWGYMVASGDYIGLNIDKKDVEVVK